jgi:hypothetical protein
MLRLDYISCGLTISSTVLVGRKRWEGWVVAGLNSVLISLIGWETSQLGFIAANIFCLVLYGYNLREWSKRPPPESNGLRAALCDAGAAIVDLSRGRSEADFCLSDNSPAGRGARRQSLGRRRRVEPRTPFYHEAPAQARGRGVQALRSTAQATPLTEDFCAATAISTARRPSSPVTRGFRSLSILSTKSRTSAR